MNWQTRELIADITQSIAHHGVRYVWFNCMCRNEIRYKTLILRNIRKHGFSTIVIARDNPMHPGFCARVKVYKPKCNQVHFSS